VPSATIDPAGSEYAPAPLKGMPEPSYLGYGLLYEALERESDLNGKREPIFVEGGLMRLAVVVLAVTAGFFLTSELWSFLMYLGGTLAN
jgi:hypothetical protein